MKKTCKAIDPDSEEVIAEANSKNQTESVAKNSALMKVANDDRVDDSAQFTCE